MTAETRIPIHASPGKPEKHDYENEHRGTCNIFVAFEPLTGNRMVEVTERRTKEDWAHFMEKIACRYETAEKIINVMDNLNTHEPGSFYEAFPPDKAKALWERFELRKKCKRNYNNHYSVFEKYIVS